MKIKYDYCKISPERDKYVVEYGHNTYKGYTLSSPIRVSDRTFSSEKKAVRFAKKIVPLECIRKEEKQDDLDSYPVSRSIQSLVNSCQY